ARFHPLEVRRPRTGLGHPRIEHVAPARALALDHEAALVQEALIVLLRPNHVHVFAPFKRTVVLSEQANARPPVNLCQTSETSRCTCRAIMLLLRNGCFFVRNTAIYRDCWGRKQAVRFRITLSLALLFGLAAGAATSASAQEKLSVNRIRVVT